MVLNPFLPVQEFHGVRSIKVNYTDPDCACTDLQNFMTQPKPDTFSSVPGGPRHREFSSKPNLTNQNQLIKVLRITVLLNEGVIDEGCN